MKIFGLMGEKMEWVVKVKGKEYRQISYKVFIELEFDFEFLG